MQFENILKQPIYLSLIKKDVNDEIIIDLKDKNITVEGDCLITLEFVKNLGNGDFYLCSSVFHKLYYKETSQGKWGSYPIGGISISVDAQVEK